MARKPQPPAYSKYHQWCDADKPYWSGVALANQVPGFATLKKTLNRQESPYNRQKLDLFLRDHMAMEPAAELRPEERAAVEQAEAVMQPPPPVPLATASKPTKMVKLKGGTAVVIDNAISNLGPQIAAPWSTSKLALPDFDRLPDVLKKARLENNERRRRASDLHDQLAEGIADPILRRDVVAEIVELMDVVSASYDAEREWVLSGATPLHDQDMRAQYDRLDVHQLLEVITNKLAPRLSYWKRQCRLRDGDHLVEAKLRVQEAEHEKAIARDLYTVKRAAHEKELARQEEARKARKQRERRVR